jgi:hypothetical protein
MQHEPLKLWVIRNEAGDGLLGRSGPGRVLLRWAPFPDLVRKQISSLPSP